MSCLMARFGATGSWHWPYLRAAVLVPAASMLLMQLASSNIDGLRSQLPFEPYLVAGTLALQQDAWWATAWQAILLLLFNSVAYWHHHSTPSAASAASWELAFTAVVVVSLHMGTFTCAQVLRWSTSLDKKEQQHDSWQRSVPERTVTLSSILAQSVFAGSSREDPDTGPLPPGCFIYELPVTNPTFCRKVVGVRFVELLLLLSYSGRLALHADVFEAGHRLGLGLPGPYAAALLINSGCASLLLLNMLLAMWPGLLYYNHCTGINAVIALVVIAGKLTALAAGEAGPLADAPAVVGVALSLCSVAMNEDAWQQSACQLAAVAAVAAGVHCLTSPYVAAVLAVAYAVLLPMAWSLRAAAACGKHTTKRSIARMIRSGQIHDWLAGHVGTQPEPLAGSPLFTAQGSVVSTRAASSSQASVDRVSAPSQDWHQPRPSSSARPEGVAASRAAATASSGPSGSGSSRQAYQAPARMPPAAPPGSAAAGLRTWGSGGHDFHSSEFLLHSTLPSPAVQLLPAPGVRQRRQGRQGPSSSSSGGVPFSSTSGSSGTANTGFSVQFFGSSPPVSFVGVVPGVTPAYLLQRPDGQVFEADGSSMRLNHSQTTSPLSTGVPLSQQHLITLDTSNPNIDPDFAHKARSIGSAQGVLSPVEQPSVPMHGGPGRGPLASGAAAAAGDGSSQEVPMLGVHDFLLSTDPSALEQAMLFRMSMGNPANAAAAWNSQASSAMSSAMARAARAAQDLAQYPTQPPVSNHDQMSIDAQLYDNMLSSVASPFVMVQGPEGTTTLTAAQPSPPAFEGGSSSQAAAIGGQQDLGQSAQAQHRMLPTVPPPAVPADVPVQQAGQRVPSSGQLRRSHSMESGSTNTSHVSWDTEYQWPRLGTTPTGSSAALHRRQVASYSFPTAQHPDASGDWHQRRTHQQQQQQQPPLTVPRRVLPRRSQSAMGLGPTSSLARGVLTQGRGSASSSGRLSPLATLQGTLERLVDSVASDSSFTPGLMTSSIDSRYYSSEPSSVMQTSSSGFESRMDVMDSNQSDRSIASMADVQLAGGPSSDWEQSTPRMAFVQGSSTMPRQPSMLGPARHGSFHGGGGGGGSSASMAGMPSPFAGNNSAAPAAPPAQFCGVTPSIAFLHNVQQGRQQMMLPMPSSSVTTTGSSTVYPPSSASTGASSRQWRISSGSTRATSSTFVSHSTRSSYESALTSAGSSAQDVPHPAQGTAGGGGLKQPRPGIHRRGSMPDLSLHRWGSDNEQLRKGHPSALSSAGSLRLGLQNIEIETLYEDDAELGSAPTSAADSGAATAKHPGSEAATTKSNGRTSSSGSQRQHIKLPAPRGSDSGSQVIKASSSSHNNKSSSASHSGGSHDTKTSLSFSQMVLPSIESAPDESLLSVTEDF